MTTIDDVVSELTVAVDEATTVLDSAVVYIQGVPGLIQAAVDAALAAGLTEAQVAAFSDLKNRIINETADLTEAIVANTDGA